MACLHQNKQGNELYLLMRFQSQYLHHKVIMMEENQLTYTLYLLDLLDQNYHELFLPWVHKNILDDQE